MRDYVLRTGLRAFIAIPAADEVTDVWATGADEVAMREVRTRDARALRGWTSATQATRRLGCLRLERSQDVAGGVTLLKRLGPPAVDGAAPPLGCTCAPVVDYTGREVARLGIFGHAADETPLVTTMNRDGWELARQVSRRLGWLPPGAIDVPADFGAGLGSADLRVRTFRTGRRRTWLM